jgi:hypothetical protein
MKRDKTIEECYYYVVNKITEELVQKMDRELKKLRELMKEKIMPFIFPEELFRVISKYPKIIKASSCVFYETGDLEFRIDFNDYCFPVLKIKGQKDWDNKFYIAEFLNKVPEEYVSLFKELVEEANEVRVEYNRKKDEVRRLRSMELKELELLYPDVYKLVDEYYNKKEDELKDYLKKQDKKIKETIT